MADIIDIKTREKIKQRIIARGLDNKNVKIEINCVNGKYIMKHNLTDNVIALETLDQAIDFLIEQHYKEYNLD